MPKVQKTEPPSKLKLVDPSPPDLPPVAWTTERWRSEMRAAAAEALDAHVPRPVLMDEQTLAQHLGVSRQAVAKLASEGAPHFYVGDRRRFEPDRVLEWLRGRNDAESAR